MATLDIQGTTKWRDKNDNDYGEFVKEAEKRNLRCGISVSAFSSNLSTN